MEATLDPSTVGCLDLHCGKECDGEHTCDARPNSVVACPCRRRFRVGSALRLVPFPERWGRPRFACTLIGNGDDEGHLSVRENAAAKAVRAEYDPWMADHQGWTLSPDTPWGPTASFQWKGTQTVFSTTCGCGAELTVNNDFVYHVECTACGQGFLVVSAIPLVELEPEEAS